MSCISEFSFLVVTYCIFKNVQRRVRIFENERSWNQKFSFQYLVLITCNFKAQPMKNFSYWSFQNLKAPVAKPNVLLNRSSKLNSSVATCNINIKQFRWNVQMLPLCCLFRNLPCSTSNLLAINADRISVTLNIFGVSQTIALDILND